jgi:hypothetical protein
MGMQSRRMSASVGPIPLRYVDEHTWTIYVVLTSRRERIAADPDVHAR